jgi:ketosteroid isomerase-like protein
MKILPIAGLLLCSSLPNFAQTTAVPAGTDPVEAINRLREGLVSSFNRGDIDGLLSHLDTNVVVTWQNGEVSHGTAGVRAYYDKMMKGDRPIVKQVTCAPEVTGRHLNGDWAVSWGNLNDHFLLTDGSDLPFNTRFTATIARRGERWVVTAFHASVNVFSNPVLTTALKKAGALFGGAGLILGSILGLVIGRVVFRKAKPSS